jgi:hypothetical protein
VLDRLLLSGTVLCVWLLWLKNCRDKIAQKLPLVIAARGSLLLCQVM